MVRPMTTQTPTGEELLLRFKVIDAALACGLGDDFLADAPECLAGMKDVVEFLSTGQRLRRFP